jgi:hypothetical protein
MIKTTPYVKIPCGLAAGFFICKSWLKRLFNGNITSPFIPSLARRGLAYLIHKFSQI